MKSCENKGKFITISNQTNIHIVKYADSFETQQYLMSIAEKLENWWYLHWDCNMDSYIFEMESLFKIINVRKL